MQTYIAHDTYNHEVLCFFDAMSTSEALEKAMYFNPSINACYLAVAPYERIIDETEDSERYNNCMSYVYDNTDYAIACQ